MRLEDKSNTPSKRNDALAKQMQIGGGWTSVDARLIWRMSAASGDPSDGWEELHGGPVASNNSVDLATATQLIQQCANDKCRILLVAKTVGGAVQWDVKVWNYE